MATPIIKPLKVQGGTLYKFSSAARDITKTFNDDGLKFSFSKFACLKIPSVKTPVSQKNNIQFDTIDGAIFDATNLSDNILTLAEHFQNYVLNFEQLLLLQSNYNSSIKQTVSERVFFKWLKEIGAIRFRQATGVESNISNFVEEDDTDSGTQHYESVVKFLGDLNVVNSVQKEGDAYSEIYVNITSTDGRTPTILFNTVSDDNYQPGLAITGTSEFISGREGLGTHPSGLTLSAFYDYDQVVVRTGQNEDWMGGSPIANTYYTEPTTFSDPSNDDIIKVRTDYGLVGSNIQYLRSKLDGITIDFNSSDYAQITNNQSINSFSDFNRSGSAENFEFNAILLYYDIYDASDPNDRTTNLYGILFLDNIVTTVADGGYIPVAKKLKYNSVTKLNGNSYGLKINIRFDSSIENAATENVINDYESYSLNLFSDALTEMKTLTDLLSKSYQNLLQNTSSISEVAQQTFSTTELNNLVTRVTTLEQSFQNANLIVSDMQAIIDAIKNVSDLVNTILSGNTPVSLTFDFNALISGAGILFTNTPSGQLSITNNVQKYNNIVSQTLDAGFNNTNVVAKKDYTNLFVDTSGGFVADDNIIININDSQYRWEDGQTYEFSFPGTYDLDQYSIIFNTDKNNVFNSGEYGKQIGTISANELTSNNKFQIICLNKFNYTFLIEKIK